MVRVGLDGLFVEGFGLVHFLTDILEKVRIIAEESDVVRVGLDGLFVGNY